MQHNKLNKVREIVNRAREKAYEQAREELEQELNKLIEELETPETPKKKFNLKEVMDSGIKAANGAFKSAKKKTANAVRHIAEMLDEQTKEGAHQ